MKRLFVRSGGGLPGLDIHCGIWSALAEKGIEATTVSGTSAGAIVSGFDASGLPAEQGAAIIRSLSDSDVRQERKWWKLRALWIKYWLETEPIEALFRQYIEPDFSKMQKDLHVCATDCRTGLARVFHKGSGVGVYEAILASMAISGVFPWRTINDVPYCDGGVSKNLPILVDWKNYDEVYLLIATRPVKYRKKDKNILSRLMLNVDWLLADQVQDVILAHQGSTKVKVLWPACEAPKGSLHFDHALIDEAYDKTKRLLEDR